MGIWFHHAPDPHGRRRVIALIEEAQVKRRAPRNLRPDPRFRVELAPGYRPTEPLTDAEWPETLR